MHNRMKGPWLKTFFFQIATDQTRSVVAFVLRPILLLCSVIYFVLVRCIVFLYQKNVLKRYRLPRKVISVGNITLGGTGKTPLVELVVQLLKENQIKPAILIRGYMNPSAAGNRFESDEGMLLKDSSGVPVIVGSNRFRLATEFLKNNSVDAFVMDDGFQHWRLARDLDIVVINAVNPFGNGFLLPRGILREPLSALLRADVFVLSKIPSNREYVDKLKSKLAAINPRCLIVEAVHRPMGLQDLRSSKVFDLSFVKGKTICSFCSIGDPDSFAALLKALQPLSIKNFLFIDHYTYEQNDISMLNNYCRDNSIRTIVTTQKDAVKLDGGAFDNAITVLALNIMMEIVDGRQKLMDKVLKVCRR